MKIRPRRRNFTVLCLHGQICKIERCRDKAGREFMRAPVPGTLGDILDEAQRLGVPTRQLVAAIRNEDHQWQLGYR